jgi:hypothetical protein
VKNGFLYLLIGILFYQCAQIVAPTGGKKDETPPNLLSSTPANKAVNFKENIISLTFDEYVAVDNLMQKLIVTPESDNPYTPQVKNQTVVLKFKKPFDDSTTYTFNFSDGIKDLAERNPAQNLKLVFSTGPTIDSGRVYGTLIDIRSQKPIFDALVGLYQISDTLDPQKIKPYYFSKTDSSGLFAIENTQIATYAMIAITDKNRNLLYNPKEESIAFLDSLVQTGSDSTHLRLYAFHSDLTPLRVQRTIPKVTDYTLVFNKGIDSLRVTFDSESAIRYYQESPTQLKFLNVPIQSDTVRATIHAVDSLGYPIEIQQKIAFLPQRGKERPTTPFTVKPNLAPNEPIDKTLRLELAFSKPFGVIHKDRITLTADSAQILSNENIRYQAGSDSTKLTIETTFQAKDSLVITIPKSAILSIESDTLQATKYKYPIGNPEDYGNLKGTIGNPNGKAFFVELLDKDFKTVENTAYTSPFTFANIKPGTYRLRLVVDENNNGRWDSGDYSRKRQPEQILVFPSELIIKANFEYEDQYFNIP